MPQGLCDVFRDLEIGRGAEVDVIRNEKGTRADRHRTRRRVDVRWTEIRYTRGILADLFTQALELASADVGQILTVGARGGALVEEDGNQQLPADALA